MPWKECSLMSEREEFVALASRPGAVISRLCRRFGISRKTAYKWLSRASTGEPDWARNLSRRPHHSPTRTPVEMEQQVLTLRQRYPYWGGRKIRQLLLEQGQANVPAASTITNILRRHDLIPEPVPGSHSPLQRFERETPNDLWQMDFKSPLQTLEQVCHPLTIVDDHSRYSLCVRACPDQRRSNVKPVLISVFQRYGLPRQMLMDNGSCWGSARSRYTRLSAWLIQLGITIRHGRHYHPQTQGKNERFNRTLATELTDRRRFRDLTDCQQAFDRFRHTYNQLRPHQAIGMQPPVSRYRSSPLSYPSRLPEIQYPHTDLVRKVVPAGFISFKGRRFQIGRAFSGFFVGLRSTHHNHIFDVFFCHQLIQKIDLDDHI